ncbi:MAG: FixH family protein [Gammaproteobacteria bacterium]|nr:FixH family protein [Gammaproteobacteria bacterium]MBU1555893.1 FixH family protein [Gammaproteobacteria bacterium]MBU2072522.1 FixH family protein [Gammaproteobacteria bacterium]MBU2181928.1 FixH family protein [Gammaproteobacteria bacterium]MBU2204234.1 FixH family protein [Gammaproteobacteria bacterium]
MQQDTKPWYKQLWPWVLIAIPVVTAIKAVHTIVIMQQHSPDLVVDDYYKAGKAINMQLAKYREAALRNLNAQVLLAGNRAVVRFNENSVLEGSLHLDFYHPTLAERDFAVDAERSGELLYVATLPITPDGKWQLVVSDASKQWKLRAELQLPSTAEIKLGY